MRPVPGPVLRGFDPPSTRYGAGHRGVDLAAPLGAPVRAAGAGRVSYAGLLAGRGVVVVVHGGLRTTYEPVAASVHVGATVAAGAVLGRVASGGHCTGCLHWGLLRGDVYLDPLQLIRRGPSRLLPVPPAAVTALLAPGQAAAVGAARSAGAGLTPAAPPTPRPQPLRSVSEPGFSLRAAELPWGVTAVLTLLAGRLLLRRRPARPERPPDGPTAQPQALQVQPPVPARLLPTRAGTGHVVDLGTERSRRRIG